MKDEEQTEMPELETNALVKQVQKFEAIDGTLFDTMEEATDHAVIVDANKTVEAHSGWVERYLKATPAVNTERRLRGEHARYMKFLNSFLSLPVTGDNIPDTKLDGETKAAKAKAKPPTDKSKPVKKATTKTTAKK